MAVVERDMLDVLNQDDLRKLEFMNAESVEDAVAIAWRNLSEDYYCHYTTLPNLLATIYTGKWFLRRSTSEKFNDLVESSKFGDANVAKCTYQLSFGQGVRESAALWGLYGKENPYAIKVLVPKGDIEAWVKELSKFYPYVEFKDVIYASIPLKRPKSTGAEKNRGLNLFWDDAVCRFAKHPEVKKTLPSKLSKDDYTGWFKDVEWCHEHETRLCVRVAKKGPDGIVVPYPKSMLHGFSYTFSPWSDQKSRIDVRNAIRNAIMSMTGKNIRTDKFKRSTVEGALNFADEKPVKCTPVRCRLGQLLKAIRTAERG